MLLQITFMKKLAHLLLILPLTALAQVPYTHISNSTFNAERVASFGVIDVTTDFLEITNSTQFDNSFIPSIWAHQQTDTRYVLRHFASTTPAWDTGDSPIMVFRAELRTALNPVAPTNGSFPWGTAAANVVNRPVFAWENGSNQLMTIRANGNVGINTTTPSAKFHNNGSVRFENLANQTNAAYMLGTDTNGNVYEYPVPAGGTGSTNDADWLKPDNTVATSINDNIYTNGNVGINVQNPSSNLHVDGTVRFANLQNKTTATYMLGTDANGNLAEYPVPAGGVGTSNADWLKPDNTLPTSINDDIYTNGKVGINVQNPSSALHSKGTVRLEDLPNQTGAIYMLGTDANGNVAEYPVPAGGTGGSSDADWLRPDNTVSTNINNDIYTNGKVGIKVQNPSSDLHVDGTIRFANLAIATTPSFMLGTDANGNVAQYAVATGGTGSSDVDWLKLNNTTPTSINDHIYKNGKVGINTNVLPGVVGTEDVSYYSLFVAGGILTEEARVALKSDWADYVFKDDYKLATLQEVEEHIKDKGHLKGIPSAAQVKQNGINVAEMDKALLEKVEELTLYIIQLNKKLDDQQKEIDELKKARK